MCSLVGGKGLKFTSRLSHAKSLAALNSLNLLQFLEDQLVELQVTCCRVVVHRVWLTRLQRGHADCSAGRFDNRVRSRVLADWGSHRCLHALRCFDELATIMCPTVQFRTRKTSTVSVLRYLDPVVLISLSTMWEDTWADV